MLLVLVPMHFREGIEPHKYQVEGINFALDHHYCIIGDAMGLGKTIQAIGLILSSGEKTLVMCPSYLKLDFADEINKFSGKDLKIKVVITAKELKDANFDDYDVIISNYEQLVNKEMNRLFATCGLVVADEVHYLKNIKANRTKAFHHYLYTTKPNRFLGLSGTPINGAIEDWYSLLMLCSYNPQKTSGISIEGVNKFAFLNKFAHKEVRFFGSRRVTKYSGMKNVEGLKKLLTGKYIRRKAEEVLDLKKIYEKVINLDLGYMEGLEDSYEEFLLAEKEGVHATVKKENAKLKANYTSKMAADIIESGQGPVVVFSDHVDPVKMITDGIYRNLGNRKGIIIREIIGGMSINERKQITDAYKRGEVDAIVATIPAASTGLTLVTGNTIIFNDLSYNPAQNAQAQKRVHRIGQDKPVFCYYVSSNDIDKHIIEKLKEKIIILREAM